VALARDQRLRRSFAKKRFRVRRNFTCSAFAGWPPAGLEKDRLGAHILGMSNTRYEIHEADDGTFTVVISDGIYADLAMTKFDSREQAEEFIADERRKRGIDGRWQPIAED
jgi:hypothetical protein